MAHAGRFEGGRALIVLGGPSGQGWERLRDQIQPDVILTANGATRLPGADYWMLTENMNYCHNAAKGGGSERMAAFMNLLDRRNTARVQLVSHRSWPLLSTYGIDEGTCICIRRAGYALDEIPPSFSLRQYGEGFLAGGISDPTGWQRKVRVRNGTVGLQLLHLAGILGCAEVHTIGFDLMFRGDQHHHWYEHPRYEADRFRTEQMFVDYKGAATQLWWLETADYLKGIEHLFERDGLQWTDHSGGLLTIKGLRCAQ